MKTIEPSKVLPQVESLVCSPSKYKMIYYEINLRAVLGAFMVGTGSSDIGNMLTTIGIEGRGLFERQFYGIKLYVHERILRRYRTIIKEMSQ